MTNEQRLSAFEAIRQLKAAYCRLLDCKQWQSLHALFSEDARFDGFGSAPDGSTRTAFVKGLEHRLTEAVSVHHCHNPEIDLLSDSEAKAIWPMMDYVQWPDLMQLSEGEKAVGFKGYGFYEETYRREGNRWVITYSRLSRLRVDFLANDHPAPRKGRLPPQTNWI
jgi:hypothetical protein